MISEVRVRSRKTRVLTRQRWWVEVVARNGEILLWSEKYANRGHAISLATEIAGHLDVDLVI